MSAELDQMIHAVGVMKPKLIGITGGIAAGKSTVARLFRELGGAVLDADALAREVTAPGSETLARIVESFGSDLLGPRGELDRARLGALVFDDPQARLRLEQIVHPAIAAAAEVRIAALAGEGHRYVFYEAALLVETGRYRQMDALVVVTAKDELRIRRLIERAGISRGEARKRLAAQAPEAEKVRLADYLVDNSGSVEQTRTQVEAIWRRITREAA